MNKGFIASGILAGAALVSYFLKYVLPNAEMIELPFGIRIPGWFALMLCAGVTWLMSDEGPASKSVRDSVVTFITKKFGGPPQPPTQPPASPRGGQP